MQNLQVLHSSAFVSAARYVLQIVIIAWIWSYQIFLPLGFCLFVFLKGKNTQRDMDLMTNNKK